jgi:hypothetical protein
MERLEGMLHGRDLEQSILARLCYLVVFNILRVVDGRVLLDQLWPAFKSMPPGGEIHNILPGREGEVNMSTPPSSQSVQDQPLTLKHKPLNDQSVP